MAIRPNSSSTTPSARSVANTPAVPASPTTGDYTAKSKNTTALGGHRVPWSYIGNSTGSNRPPSSGCMPCPNVLLKRPCATWTGPSPTSFADGRKERPGVPQVQIPETGPRILPVNGGHPCLRRWHPTPPIRPSSAEVARLPAPRIGSRTYSFGNGVGACRTLVRHPPSPRSNHSPRQ